MKKIIFLALCLCLLVTFAWAETVLLKTGQKIEGRIIERNSEIIKIDFEGVELSYMLSEVDSINGTRVSQAGEQEAQPFKESETERNESAPQPAVEVLPPGADTLKYPQPRNIITAVAVGAALAVIVIALITYILSSFFLQRIARKTQNSPAWLAWVPVANLFLVCKMAGLSYWWLLTFAAAFIPYLGVLCTLGFNGLAWYKIAIARGKPGWVGILCAVPVINLVVMGYLAFSK